MHHLLETGTATPSDIARALELPLNEITYHMGFFAKRGIVILFGETQRRGRTAHHYQLTDRGRVASLVWGTSAVLLVTDFERETGRGNATVTLDAEGLSEAQVLTGAYLTRLGELGLQTRERFSADRPLTKVAVLMGTDHVKTE